MFEWAAIILLYVFIFILCVKVDRLDNSLGQETPIIRKKAQEK